MTEFVTIRKKDYPALYEALEHIEHDQMSSKPDGEDFYFELRDSEVYTWPPEMDFTEIDAALASLSFEDRETLAIGEQDEMVAIANQSSQLQIAHHLFEEFFTNDYEQRGA
jgi:hypothetical protein